MRAGSVPEIRALTEEELRMRILFIGNSHTYFNDMTALVAKMAQEEGEKCEVTMIAHGGWFLEQHAKEEEVRFNILYGNYDYVVLQEHAHPFGPEEKMFAAAETIGRWIREAGSTPVAYMTWTEKGKEGEQPRMTAAYEEMARRLSALLAPVGTEWWKYQHAHPEAEMYAPDGAHASPLGSQLAAEVIWKTIRANS